MRFGRRMTYALSLVMLGGALLGAQTPAGTAFTYQGRLTDGGSPANGSYDLQFTLYDSAGGGNTVGNGLTHTNVPVANGVFSVLLDFGASAFTGNARWVEVGVRPGGTGGGFTIVSPRHQITPIPYALDAQRLGGQLPAAYQNRVSGTCTVGSWVRAIGADGSVTCAEVNGADIVGSIPDYVTTTQFVTELGPLETAVGSLEADVVALQSAAALRNADQTFTGANVFNSESNVFAGQVRIVANTAACEEGFAGSLRYNASSKTIEFCNGSAWLTLATAP